MRKFYFIGFALLLIFDTFAQTSFKLTANGAQPLEFSTDWLCRVFSAPWVYIAILGYIGSFFNWMTLLTKAPVGPAFAASHLEVVTVMLTSIWLFNEQITLLRLVGAVFILIGITFLALAEKELHQKENNKIESAQS